MSAMLLLALMFVPVVPLRAEGVPEIAFSRRTATRDVRETLFSDENGDRTSVVYTGKGAQSLRWSQDGAYLATMTGWPSVTVRLIPANGGKPREIFSGAGYEALNWAPDGKSLLFPRYKTSDVHRVELAGGRITQVCPPPKSDDDSYADAVSSPDGKRLLLEKIDLSSSSDLLMASSDCSNPRRIGEKGSGGYDLSWSRSGILFVNLAGLHFLKSDGVRVRDCVLPGGAVVTQAGWAGPGRVIAVINEDIDHSRLERVAYIDAKTCAVTKTKITGEGLFAAWRPHTR